MQFTIIDTTERQKRILTEGAITYIGSDERADIQLQSDQIELHHLQILYWDGAPSECKVVNLSQQPVGIGNHRKTVLAPQEFVTLTDGNEILLADHKIIVHLPLVSKVLSSSKFIRAAFNFPDTVLPPNTVMETEVTIQNAGPADDCQFHVDVRGLPDDCYKIDPIPLMYSGAVEKVKLLIYHRKTRPAAGPLEIELRITAPQNYPGEEFVIRQGILISPVFEYGFEFESDQTEGELPDEDVGFEESAVVLSVGEGTEPDGVDVYSGNNWVGEQVDVEPEEGKREYPIDQEEPIATAAELEVDVLLGQDEEKSEESARFKVISNQFDDFWDDPD